MNNDIESVDELTPEASREAKRLRRKQILSRSLFILAGLLLVGALQTVTYHKRYQAQIEDANSQLRALMTEKTRATLQQDIQSQFRTVIETLRDTEGLRSEVEALYETLAEHFQAAPLGTVAEILAAMMQFQEEMNTMLADGTLEAIPEGVETQLADLTGMLEHLQRIYTVPYEEIQASLESPPLYLWPMAQLLTDDSRYLSSVTFNRAIYLSQIGEMGTARVLLTGLHASAEDPEFMGLIYYGLGRLQWELFLDRAEPQNYFQAVKYLRQSMQADPMASLPKRLFDYMLSLTQAESTPGAGKGDPTTLTEGEAGAVSDGTPMF